MMGTDIEAAAIAAALGAFAWGAIADAAALGLEPGDVILSGSFTQAVPVAAGDTVNTDFGRVRPAVHHIRERKVEGDLMLESLDHDTGGYAYLPGGDFASGGVVAVAEMSMRHVILTEPVSLSTGLDLVRRELDRAERPLVALCGLELRLPKSLTMPQFEEFNDWYLERLGEWGLLRDGVPPLARTNVAPSVAPPGTTSLIGFSYTVAAPTGEPDLGISGAADLDCNGVPVRAGESTVDAMVAKASYVVDEVNARMKALGAGWSRGVRTHLYCARPAVLEIARSALGPSSYGLTWHDSVPPVAGLELEIDVRRQNRELIVEVD